MIRACAHCVIAAILYFASCRPIVAQAGGPPAIDEAVPAESNNYPLGPDSKPQPGVPQGRTLTFELNNSKIFPATTRKITVYVPAAYSSSKPACVYVGLDGLGFN